MDGKALDEEAELEVIVDAIEAFEAVTMTRRLGGREVLVCPAGNRQRAAAMVGSMHHRFPVADGCTTRRPAPPRGRAIVRAPRALGRGAHCLQEEQGSLGKLRPPDDPAHRPEVVAPSWILECGCGALA